VYDTAGLNEATGGTVDKINAICQLVDSFRQIKRINLIVYVRKCEALTEVDEKNYHLIIRILLQSKVKALCFNTYADNEADQMDDWWRRTERIFNTRSLKFSTGCSVIAGRPKASIGNKALQLVYDDYLKRAKEILWQSIEKSVKLGCDECIELSAVNWKFFFIGFINYFFGTNFDVNKPRDADSLRRELTQTGLLNEGEAAQLANKFSFLLI
jgi:hypothetical protein